MKNVFKKIFNKDCANYLIIKHTDSDYVWPKWYLMIRKTEISYVMPVYMCRLCVRGYCLNRTARSERLQSSLK